jgi:hypothetical protein
MTMQQGPTTVRPATHSMAVLSLVLSILGIFPPILPLVGPIAGVAIGMIARKEILARPDLYSGEDLARAGIIVGWVGIGLSLAACILIALGISLFAISGHSIFLTTPIIITVQP